MLFNARAAACRRCRDGAFESLNCCRLPLGGAVRVDGSRWCSGAEVAHGLSLAALPEEKGRLKDLAVADLSSVSNRRPGVGVGRTP